MSANDHTSDEERSHKPEAGKCQFCWAELSGEQTACWQWECVPELVQRYRDALVQVARVSGRCTSDDLETFGQDCPGCIAEEALGLEYPWDARD